MSDTKKVASKLINQLRDGKELHDEFAKEFKSRYQIAGKLIDDWKKHFQIKIPPDFTPQVCLIVGSKLMELHQEASFLKAEVEARLAACKSTNNDMYRTKYASLVLEYKEKGGKLPAKDTLAALAEDHIGDTKNAQTHAEIELAFWKEILSDLNNSRKSIKDATINLSIEAKVLNQDKYLDYINTPKTKD